MGLLLLAALVIMWAAFLLPTWRRSPTRSTRDFERNMDMLAETERNGRWIVTPRKGTTFLGSRGRAQARARERRRRVLVLLLEAIALSALIGAFPPLRAMWYATGALLVLLGCYVWALVTMRSRATEPVERIARVPARPARQRSAADASNRTARRAFDDLPAMSDDLVHVVVKPAAEVARG